MVLINLPESGGGESWSSNNLGGYWSVWGVVDYAGIMSTGDGEGSWGISWGVCGGSCDNLSWSWCIVRWSESWSSSYNWSWGSCDNWSSNGDWGSSDDSGWWDAGGCSGLRGGTWFVGWDGGTETESISDVVDNSLSSINNTKWVRSNNLTESVSRFTSWWTTGGMVFIVSESVVSKTILASGLWWWTSWDNGGWGGDDSSWGNTAESEEDDDLIIHR